MSLWEEVKKLDDKLRLEHKAKHIDKNTWPNVMCKFCDEELKLSRDNYT